MPDYWSYLALRLLTAVGSVGLFNSTFTMTIEFMGSKEVRSINSIHSSLLNSPFMIILD